LHYCGISVPDDPETEVDEEIDNLLTTDFEIGHYIRERIIPRAVLYYTGMIWFDFYLKCMQISNF